jgi:hypothetical protein
MPIILATWEARSGGLWFKARPDKKVHEIPSPPMAVVACACLPAMQGSTNKCINQDPISKLTNAKKA